MTTALIQDFQARIQAASATGTPLRLRGGGSKDWYGQSLQGEVLDTRAYQGVVDYDPAELVITARCGTPLADIEALLAEHHQMLAFEPPHFGAATFGGMLASGLSGPRRMAVGSVRDFVLGSKLMNGRGEVLSFGGTVMKNVAGYDVSRLLAGSLGTLGLILEASIKVLPKPFAEATVQFELDETSALQQLNTWGGQPLPLASSAWHAGVLTLRLAGAEAAVKSARTKLGGQVLATSQAEAFWHSLREQTHAFFSTPTFSENLALWRIATPSTAAPLSLAGAQLTEWGGSQRWLITDAPTAAVRQAAQAVGGHATLYRGGHPAEGVFTPLAAPLLAIHRQLKQTFDPAGIFSRGRLYPEF